MTSGVPGHLFQRPQTGASGASHPVALNDFEYETLSKTSGAYVGKYTKQGGKQVRAGSAHPSRSNTSSNLRLGANSKVYYPNEYYKRVGY